MATMVLVAVLALATLSAPAAGLVPAQIQATLNFDGSGRMVVNGATNPPAQTWIWQACDQNGGSCTPFGSGRSLSSATAPPGTTFSATSNTGLSARSPVWHGTVSATKRPTVRGQTRVNELVTPVAGTWDGGWDGDIDETQLAACARANGTHCITLTDQQYPGGCPSGGAVISPAFVGRYLRVADQRLGAGTAFAASAISSPYGGRIWLPGPTISVAVVGRIKPAKGPRKARCGPPPFRARGS